MKYDLSFEEDDFDEIVSSESAESGTTGMECKDATEEASTHRNSLEDEKVYRVMADDSSSEVEKCSLNGYEGDGLDEGEIGKPTQVRTNVSDNILASDTNMQKDGINDMPSDSDEMTQESYHTEGESHESIQEKSDHYDDRYEQETFESNPDSENSQIDHSTEEREDHAPATDEKSERRSNASFDYSMDFSQADAAGLETSRAEVSSLLESQQSKVMYTSSDEDKSRNEIVPSNNVRVEAFQYEKDPSSPGPLPSSISNFFAKDRAESTQQIKYDVVESHHNADEVVRQITSTLGAHSDTVAMSSKKATKRVIILREYDSDKKAREKKDASTQFTGNHAIIQTDLIAPGMFTVCSATYHPERRASTTDEKHVGTSCCRHHCGVEHEVPAFKDVARQLSHTTRNNARPSNKHSGESETDWDDTEYTQTPSSFYKQQLWLIQAQIEQKREEMQRCMKDRQDYCYTSLEKAENHILLHRPAPLELWEALMRVDPTIGAAKAKHLARLVSTS